MKESIKDKEEQISWIEAFILSKSGHSFEAHYRKLKKRLEDEIKELEKEHETKNER